MHGHFAVCRAEVGGAGRRARGRPGWKVSVSPGGGGVAVCVGGGWI